MIGLKDLQKAVHKLVPHTQKYIAQRVISITVRMLADEYQKDPYRFSAWLGRYQGTIRIFENIPPNRKGYHDDKG